ncbi:MAG: toprim domain-containing protein, partial [Deltaproteobacteria bacterium]|nr:toprim domain-containing protein [Deltaproteobacteria bacterium]
KSAALYGLQQNRRGIHNADNVLIVEGYFDVMALAKAGIGFAVAPCGTALTDRQLAGIRRHTTNVTMLFDADEAGRRAAVRVTEMCLEQGLWPQRLQVTGGKDPDEFIVEHGADAMKALLLEAKPLLDFFIDMVADELLAKSIDADGAMEKVAPMLARLGEGNSRYERYERRVIQAIDIHTDPRSIKRVVKAASKRIATQPRRSSVELGSGKKTDRPRGPQRAPQGPGPDSGGPRGRPPGPPDRSGGPPGPQRGGPPPDRGQGPGGPRFDDFVPPDDDYGPPPDALDGIDFDAPAPRSAPPLRRQREPEPTPPQLKLLRLLVQDLENVARAVTDYGVEAWLEQPTVLRIVKRFLEAAESGRQPTSTDLLSDVETPSVRNAVGEALASEDAWYGADILETATQECLLRLRREYVARRYVQVKRELDAMQRSGKAVGAEILGLTQESLLLQREREELDQHLRKN